MLARISLGIAAIMVGILAIGFYVSGQRGGERLYPESTGERGPAGLARFYQQALDWRTCERAVCTWVRVPVDYDKPTGKTLRLRVKLRPADGGNGRGVLVVNPGGPGGSGVDYVAAFASHTSPSVRSTYDIVGFDPRGVARSTPLTCLSDKDFAAVLALDPDPEDDKEASALRAGYSSIARACAKRSGALAVHVSTEEVARDMDVVRALLGEDKLNYFGASYGTQIGSTYAQLFAPKVGRMVLDGGIDPTLNKERQGFGQARSLGHALRSYLKDCMRSDPCPVGKSVAAGIKTITSLLAQLEVKPMETESPRDLTATDGVYAIALPLYDPTAWPTLTTALVRSSFGDGTVLLALADRYFGRTADGAFRSNAGQVISAVRCLDFPKAESNSRIKELEASYQEVSPVFGRTLAWTSTECAGWPLRPANPQRPVSAREAAPILVVGTTRDPATPYAWSKALASQLKSAVLVTREGDGHTGYAVGSRCVDNAVNRLLLEGDVPSKDLRCEESRSKD